MVKLANSFVRRDNESIGRICYRIVPAGRSNKWYKIWSDETYSTEEEAFESAKRYCVSHNYEGKICVGIGVVEPFQFKECNTKYIEGYLSDFSKDLTSIFETMNVERIDRIEHREKLIQILKNGLLEAAKASSPTQVRKLKHKFFNF